MASRWLSSRGRTLDFVNLLNVPKSRGFRGRGPGIYDLGFGDGFLV